MAYWHPQIVHFVIALLFIGMGARMLSLLPLPNMFRFFSPAAATLIVMGSIATIFAVKSGDDAHGPAERVPGARPLVVEHEELGERARNIFLAIAAVELIAIALYQKQKVAKGLHAVSAAAGIFGLFTLYHAAEHGGELVYNYAANVGLRSGDTVDLRRSLTAVLYHNAMAHRTAGRHEEAARLVGELVRLQPNDPETQLVGAESVIRDQKNPRGAIPILQMIATPDERIRRRKDRLVAEAESLLATLPPPDTVSRR
jgi:uncharacterized membrane protein